jgi:DNA polymerase-3 subunit alpha
VIKRGDHDAAGTKMSSRPLPPRDGMGPSGSWRDPDVDTTHHWKGAKRGDHDVEGTKYGAKVHPTPIIQRVRPVRGNIKAMRFASLHHHSTLGSYLDAVGLPEAHVRRATELNMVNGIALTEHGNIDSHARFDKAAEKAGIRPIFGCEVYMPTTSVNKEGQRVLWSDPEAQTQRKHHLTILAQTPEGYSNLCKVVTASWLNFYHDPIVTWEDLVLHKAGLIILSGCQGSLLFCATVGGKGIPPEQASYRRGLRIAQMFKREFGDNYKVEVQAFPELSETRRFNPLAARIARAVGADLVGSVDVHYTVLEEAEVQKILHNLRPGEKQSLEEQARSWGYKAPLCPPPNDNSIYRRLIGTGLTRNEALEAIVNTELIAQSCTATLPRVPMIRFPVERATNGEFNDIEPYWRHLLNEGWRFRGFDKLPQAERQARLDRLRYEERLVHRKDFIDYFLFVRYGVVRIKDEGVPVGPARGSAAASELAYILRITEVDPLRPEFAGLLRFERFISEDREDLPDIDLDFPGSSRPRLRQIYVELMGGEEYVNNVGTFTQFKGKNSLDDIARVFRVPAFEVATIKDFLIERSSGDMRSSSTVEDTIAQFEKPRDVLKRYPDLAKASWLEGNIKGFGVHAAALVLSNEPITNYTAVVEREVPKGSGNWINCVALDKKDAERMGLVKMDFLGLSTMEMLWRALRWLGKDLNWLYSLPLDDPRVYACLQDVDVTGIFSMEGRSQRYVCSMIKPEKFSEIMDCGALCRPGPLHNGAARMYGEIKQGGKIATARHPALADLLSPTQYQIVYQEQILEIARVIGGFDARGVGEIRTIIAKKEGEQAFEKARERFIDGVRTLHKRFPQYPPMSDEVGNMTFGDCVTSGAYAFNAAHCAAYGLITYYITWLKVYEHAVFYASALAESIKDKDRTRQLLRDAHHHGVRVHKPDLRASEANWTPLLSRKLPTILAGFQSVEGIGEKSASIVEEWRDKERPDGWGELQHIRGFGVKTILSVTDWLKREDPFGAFKLDNDIELATRELLEQRLPGSDGKPLPVPTHTAADLALDEHAGKALHVYWIGTFVQRNIRDIFEQNRARGQVLDPASIKDPHLAEWAMLTGEDQTDQLLIKIDRWRYPKFREAIFNFRMGRDLLLIQGVKPARSGVRSLNVKKLWVISPDE